MYISLNWVKQYIPEGIKITHLELKEKFTYSCAEVENIKNIGSDLKDIVVGEILKIKKHPKTDKLKIILIDTGNKKRRNIVCAAKNIYEGAKVPVALPGGIVLNPKEELNKQTQYKIQDMDVMGVHSQGMLCSQKELGLSDDHEGIWILPQEVKVGENLLKLISDTVFEIENKNLTNRPDCFSHIGIAREISVILKTPHDYKESEEMLIPTRTLPLVVKVENSNLCKRYTAIAIQGIKVKPSPFWLQIKLLAIGIKPINNIVDATNYVMLDLGQPLHAFDYNKLKSPRIIVRTARKGEKTVTIDSKERILGKNNLLICDTEKPIGIAGIMGSLNSEIDEDTTDIIIESANFEMYNIRRSEMELGIRSEASTRFEKGIDPNLTLPALKEVVQLITEISEGEVSSQLIDIYKEKVTEKIIEFELKDIPRLLGIEIKREEVLDILESLKLKVISPEAAQTKINIKIPTFRRDLNIKEDILEEIARIYGFNKFNYTLPEKTIKAVKINPRREIEKRIKLILSSLGFDEIYSYSFTGEKQYTNTLLNIKDCIKIKNPISKELSYMSNNLLPNILERTLLNQQSSQDIAIYEISRVFLKEKDQNGLHKQPKQIIVVESKASNKTNLFYNLKGKLESLFEQINIKNIQFEKTKNIQFLHPNYQAFIKIKDHKSGYIGIIHPQIKLNWDLKHEIGIFVLEFDDFEKYSRKFKVYKKLSLFPQVKRDLSFWVKENIEAEKILSTAEKSASKYIKNIMIPDIYKPKVKSDKKGIILEIILQSSNHTLNEKDIKDDINSIIRSLKDIGCNLRKK